jgi:homoserine dehydrogenase/aspartokinase/homoserine dehydrogenase 1
MLRVPLIIFGLGHVGRAFLRQFVTNGAELSRRLKLHLVVVGLADRHHMLLDPVGLDQHRLLALADALSAGQTLLQQQQGQEKESNTGFLDTIIPLLAEPPVVIDATAAEGMEQGLLHALDQGCHLALANNRALIGPWSVSRRFFEEPNVRFEATVGAGLPATRTLRDLIAAGDRVSAIEGSLSGTVGYICSQLQLNVPFSVALAQARELGYTEPEPREDLSGQDSARKILVMGRLAGWPLEMRDVQVEQLCSPELANLPVDVFMDRVMQLDDNMARRVQGAREEGCALRYVAEIDSGAGRVGLRAVPRVSQLGVLQGPECLVTLFTARYTVSPLTISGRGVGPELAAAALLSDVVSLACSNFSRLPAE